MKKELVALMSISLITGKDELFFMSLLIIFTSFCFSYELSGFLCSLPLLKVLEPVPYKVRV